MSDDGRWHARLRVAVCALVLLLLPCPVGGCGRSPQHLKSGQCKPGDPLAGVYLPSRLAVHNACTTVAGTVDCVQAEPDGDIHVRLRPDPAYRRLLTAANAFQQCPQQKDPHLVVEIIPQVGHGAFEDNSATKAGFTTPTAPAAGEHVTVTGPYVWDSNLLHDLVYPGRNVKDWAEIHPAWNITIDQPAHKPVPDITDTPRPRRVDARRAAPPPRVTKPRRGGTGRCAQEQPVNRNHQHRRRHRHARMNACPFKLGRRPPATSGSARGTATTPRSPEQRPGRSAGTP